MAKVTKYQLLWSFLKDEPYVAVDLDDGTKEQLKVRDAAGLAAVAAILREPSVFLYNGNLSNFKVI